MIDHISTPRVGDGLHASWGASVANAVNRLGERADKESTLPNLRDKRPKPQNDPTEDKDTLYDCDGHSISRIALSSSDAEHLPTHGNRFQLMHFGTYLPQGETVPQGSFLPPDTLEIDQYDTGGTNVAIIVRSGNSPQPDANHIGYKRLVIRSHSEPFLYACTTLYNENTGEALGNPVRTFENCVFNFDGIEQWVDPIQPPVDGSVYLVSTKDTSGVWMHAMQEEPGIAPEGGEVINTRLYDFASGKVVVDYRAASLCISSAKVDKTLSLAGQEVAKIAASANIDITQKTLIAGPGINISESADGTTLTLSATAISGDKNITIDYVHGIRYNQTEYQFEKLMAHVNLSTGDITYGSNKADDVASATWEAWSTDGSSTTVPISGVI